MNLKRAVTLMAVGGALAAWLAAAATSGPRRPAAADVAPESPVDARGAALAAEVARLRDGLRPSVAPTHARNLFAFRSARPQPAPATMPPARPVAPALTEAPPAPAVPSLRLVGLAEDTGPEGPVRTAIITGLGQLFMVKEGDTVTARYRVARISADVVELAEVGERATIRLALK
jgi:hypothetical protein